MPLSRRLTVPKTRSNADAGPFFKDSGSSDRHVRLIDLKLPLQVLKIRTPSFRLNYRTASNSMAMDVDQPIDNDERSKIIRGLVGRIDQAFPGQVIFD